MKVLIGTAGFAYDDWRGTWYPPDLPRNQMLDFYASVFDALEINATYYRTPTVETARGMIQRAKGRLRFAVKAPGAVTHERRTGEDVVAPWRRFVDPFAEAGVLAAVLFQFPNAFRRGAGTSAFLAQIAAIGEGMTPVVEMRHESWDTADADAELRELGLARAAVDQPEMRGLSESGRTAPSDGLAYFRLHGRNANAWYAREEGDPSARYRYRYNAEEMEPWARETRAAGERGQTALVFFNNHPDGNAPRNAEEFATMVNQPLRGGGYRDLFA